MNTLRVPILLSANVIQFHSVMVTKLAQKTWVRTWASRYCIFIWNKAKICTRLWSPVHFEPSHDGKIASFPIVRDQKKNSVQSQLECANLHQLRSFGESSVFNKDTLLHLLSNMSLKWCITRTLVCRPKLQKSKLHHHEICEEIFRLRFIARAIMYMNIFLDKRAWK